MGIQMVTGLTLSVNAITAVSVTGPGAHTHVFLAKATRTPRENGVQKRKKLFEEWVAYVILKLYDVFFFNRIPAASAQIIQYAVLLKIRLNRYLKLV